MLLNKNLYLLIDAAEYLKALKTILKAILAWLPLEIRPKLRLATGSKKITLRY